LGLAGSIGGRGRELTGAIAGARSSGFDVEIIDGHLGFDGAATRSLRANESWVARADNA
jgi:hypothetical protein